MNPTGFFIDRRQGNERRTDPDPCKNMSLDLFHRKRRKSGRDRRAADRTLIDDYYAYMATQEQSEADQPRQ